MVISSWSNKLKFNKDHMNKEFKRMMKLAGLTEIKINKPEDFIKLKLPTDPTNGNTKIIVNDFTSVEDFEKEYDVFIKDLIKLNPQISTEFFLKDHTGLPQDVIDTIYTDYPEGVTMSEFYRIYFVFLFSNLISNYDKYEDDEIDNRVDKYLHIKEKFADNAMRGRWLLVPGVTS